MVGEGSLRDLTLGHKATRALGVAQHSLGSRKAVPRSPLR